MELTSILDQREGLARTAGLVAWLQGLFPEGAEPVLVGGAAVELYTGGAYVTGDLDLVGFVPRDVAVALRQSGFTRKGRHWLHEAGQVFVEFPGEALRDGERRARLLVGEHEVVVVSIEDAVADRLAAWQHWKSVVDGVNAWLLWRAQKAAIERERLVERAAALHAEAALRALLVLARQMAGRQPTSEEIEQWAQRGP